MPKLTRMPLQTLVRGWRPGTVRKTWVEEAEYLKTADMDRTNQLREAVKYYNGFTFADLTSPIKLGNDGRVWNGHHRIILALELEEEKKSSQWAESDTWRRFYPTLTESIILNVHIVGPDEREWT